MLLGSHLSVAGGPHLAVERAAEYGFQTVAIFVRNQQQWRSRPLAEETVQLFREARRRHPIRPIVAHGSYLINLAGAEPVRGKSLVAMADELDRCRRLGVGYYVLHPGSPGEAGRDVGIARVAEALNELIAAGHTDGTGETATPQEAVTILLETTAGAGHQLGATFEELAEILARVDRPERVGVCLDTCHVFAAGYDLRTPHAYAETMGRLDGTVGLRRLGAVHANDSLFGLGSRRDRHAHIGKGKLGRAAFANFVRDERLATVPLILETPKGLDARGRNWDKLNAAVLRRLAGRTSLPRGK